MKFSPYNLIHQTLYSPVISLVNRFSTPVLVLIYHRVTVLPDDPQMLAVSPENFRAQLQHLRNYPILRFEDDWSDVREPSIVITFDDGYADNLLQALPILEEFAVPATFFVNTGNLDTLEEYWWDELERLILLDASCPETFVLAAADGRTERRWNTSTNLLREKMYADLHRRILRSADLDLCTRVIAQLRIWRGVSSEGRSTHRALSMAELKRLASHPLVTIGGHAVSHLPLSLMSEGEQHQEIASSKKLLEDLLGNPVSVFSYPFGTKREYSRTTLTLVKRAGFLKAAANFPGQWHSWTDNFQIPRNLVRNWGGDYFLRRLKGFWTA